MVLVNYKIVNGKDGVYHVGRWMSGQLDKIKKRLSNETTKLDYVIVIDGEEGSAKSTLASQIGYYIDPTFIQERMCLTPEEFTNQVNKAEIGQCVVFDEAFTGLASRSALSEVNKLMVEMMMEMRAKRLMVIICIPSVFYLEKYVCLHRARALLHTYFKNGKPGQYLVYNQKKLRQLYLYGKRKMSYSVPTVRIKQRFFNKHPIDWAEYEKRKGRALKSKRRSTMVQRQIDQRDGLLARLQSQGFTIREISEIMDNLGEKMSYHTIKDGIKRYKKRKGIDVIEKI